MLKTGKGKLSICTERETKSFNPTKTIKKYNHQFNFDTGVYYGLGNQMQEVKNKENKKVYGKQWVLIFSLWWRGKMTKKRSESCFTMSWSKHNEHVDEYNTQIKKSKLSVNNKNQSRRTNLANTMIFWQDRYIAIWRIKSRLLPQYRKLKITFKTKKIWNFIFNFLFRCLFLCQNTPKSHVDWSRKCDDHRRIEWYWM
jgi:hypothetical protein